MVLLVALPVAPTALDPHEGEQLAAAVAALEVDVARLLAARIAAARALTVRAHLEVEFVNTDTVLVVDTLLVGQPDGWGASLATLKQIKNSPKSNSRPSWGLFV